MHWDTLEPAIRKQVLAAPGGTSLVDLLFNSLELADNQRVLDLCPGPGAIPSILAREYKVNLTVIAGDPAEERLSETSAQLMGVIDKVRVIPGSANAIPVASEEFDRIYCVGHPFLPVVTPASAKEIYRILAPNGLVCLAGPASFRNDTPEYFEPSLAEYDGVRLRTPAYTALMYSREGFHIMAAEYISEAWDRITEWLSEAPPEVCTETLRRAIIEDSGRWLSIGLIVLRKPPRPTWAV